MNTRDVVLAYLENVGRKSDWEIYLSEDLQFTNFTYPVKQAKGKRASLEGIRRFYSMVQGMEVEALIVEGDRACALVRYDLLPPMGPGFQSHIAEVFTVAEGKIQSYEIYFDSAPYPKGPEPQT